MVDTISFRCDACETNLQVPGDSAAKRIICTSCGAPVKVPVLFEGPAIAYDDAPPAPNIFTIPTARVVKGPPPWMQWVKLAAGLVIAGGAVAIIWFAVNKALTNDQANEDNNKAFAAAAQQRAERDRAAEERSAKERAEKERISAAAKTAAATAKAQADQELRKLQQEQERLKRELAAARPAPKPQPAPVQTAAKPAAPASDLPSVEQLEKDLKRLNAEMLVTRAKLTKAREEAAYNKNRLAISKTEIERQKLMVRAQELATQRVSSAVPYSETQVGAALRLEDQARQRLDRLLEEQDKHILRLSETESQLPDLEEAARVATANYSSTKDLLRQLAASTAAADGAAITTTATSTAGK